MRTQAILSRLKAPAQKLAVAGIAVLTHATTTVAQSFYDGTPIGRFEDCYNIPIRVLNTISGDVVEGAFSYCKDLFLVQQTFFRIAYDQYFPQQIADLFNRQTCAAFAQKALTYSTVCGINTYLCEDGVLGGTMIRPAEIALPAHACRAWDILDPPFQVSAEVATCFNQLSAEACNIVFELQHQETKTDNQKMLMTGGVLAGAAALGALSGYLWTRRSHQQPAYSRMTTSSAANRVDLELGTQSQAPNTQERLYAPSAPPLSPRG